MINEQQKEHKKICKETGTLCHITVEPCYCENIFLKLWLLFQCLLVANHFFVCESWNLIRNEDRINITWNMLFCVIYTFWILSFHCGLIKFLVWPASLHTSGYLGVFFIVVVVVMFLNRTLGTGVTNTVVSCHGGAGNWTWVLWKNSQCS